VHGIAGLEGNDPLPAVFLYFVAYLDRGTESIREIILEVTEVQHLDGTGDGKTAGA